MKIVYRCDVCHQPVRAGTGYVCASYADRARYREALGIWKLEVEANQHTPAGVLGPVISGTALLSHPERAPWRVLHRACDPDPDDDGGASFDVGDVSSPEDLLELTAHLIEKRWVLGETEWSSFIRAHVSAKALDA